MTLIASISIKSETMEMTIQDFVATAISGLDQMGDGGKEKGEVKR